MPRGRRAIDPVVAGAQIVVGLQALVARRVDPLDSAVLSTCQFHAGSAGNVIPEFAVLNGTVRTLRDATRDEMERNLRAVATHTAEAHGCTAEILYERGYPGVVNDRDATERARRAAATLVGQDNVVTARPPSMGGEDFSYMALKVPGCFVRIGQNDGGRFGTPVHHPRYDFNDAILPVGASLWATLVEQELPG